MLQSLSVNWTPVKGLEVLRLGFWKADPSKVFRAYCGNPPALLENMEACFDLQSVNHKEDGKRIWGFIIWVTKKKTFFLLWFFKGKRWSPKKKNWLYSMKKKKKGSRVNMWGRNNIKSFFYGLSQIVSGIVQSLKFISNLYFEAEFGRVVDLFGVQAEHSLAPCQGIPKSPCFPKPLQRLEVPQTFCGCLVYILWIWGLWYHVS